MMDGLLPAISRITDAEAVLDGLGAATNPHTAGDGP
jgi:hypothetical protein